MRAETEFHHTSARRREPVLERDRALLASVHASSRDLASAALAAPVVSADIGRMRSMPRQPDDCLGLLVLDGLLVRSMTVQQAGSVEIIGEGDVIRPWMGDVDDDLLAFDSRWEALTPTRLAVLDRLFVQRAARWPEVLCVLYGRGVERARRLAAQSAISHFRRVDVRLLILLWRLATRWGRVTPSGLVVPLPVTHSTLARMVGAQRPTVTTALAKLVQEGRLSRRAEGEWTLHGDPPDFDSPSLRPARHTSHGPASAPGDQTDGPTKWS